MPGTEAAANFDRVVAVHGSVLDPRFPCGALPAIAEAVAVETASERKSAPSGARFLIAEVQQHLDANTVRAVALGNNSGLRRGLAVRAGVRG